MKRRIDSFFKTIGNICYLIARKIYQSPQEIRVAPWFEIQGDKTLRLKYDLNEKSIVFDLGGYEGQWASDIFSKYCCRIYIFEPVPEFAQNIEQRFFKNPKISVHPFGLSGKTCKEKLCVSADGSSVFKQSSNSVEITLLKATDFLKDNNIYHIDLMKINIEGGEYSLLEHLIETGFVKQIDNIQVQFHDFVPNAKGQMQKIQTNLEKTHQLTYQYLFVWENWRIR
jgi:FkbM family methyltransferase